MKTENKNQKGTRFWKIYGSITIGFFCVLVIGLIVFYQFMLAYESSQPSGTADAYVEFLTRQQLIPWIEDAVNSNPPVYENAGAIIRTYVDALPDAPYESYRLLSSGSTEHPVYGVYAKDILLARITLEQNETGKFGFSNWSVIDTEILLDQFPVHAQTHLIYAPLESTVTVNGITLDSTANTTETVYPFTSQFESDREIPCICYELSGLFFKPDATCMLNGISCQSQESDQSIYFLYPDSSVTTYSITVPQGSTVAVNQILLDDSYKSGNAAVYPYSDLESDCQDIPASVTYTIPNLFSRPDISVLYRDQNLNVTLDDATNQFYAEYPKNLLYSCILTVPEGSLVTMRGKDCSAYLSTEKIEAFPALYESSAASPKLDQYMIDDLFFEPDEVQVSLHGQSLELQHAQNGNLCTYVGAYPTCDNTTVRDTACAFVQAYFHYTSEGYNNTDQNVENALQYVSSSSDLYKRIARSVESFRFVTPVTSSVTKKLEVQRIYRMTENQYVAVIAFDIEQKIYYVSRAYAGEIQLSISVENGKYRVDGMVIDNQ